MNKYAAAIALKDNSFLLIKNEKRGWELPGGKVKKEETPEKAIKREFLEETGHKLKDPELIFKKGNGYFFKGKIGKKISESEFYHSFFKELPSQLSFSRKEYEEILESL